MSENADNTVNYAPAANATNLTLCEDCGGTISRNARACPRCGRVRVRRAKWLWIGLLSGVCCVAGIIAIVVFRQFYTAQVAQAPVLHVAAISPPTPPPLLSQYLDAGKHAGIVEEMKFNPETIVSDGIKLRLTRVRWVRDGNLGTSGCSGSPVGYICAEVEIENTKGKSARMPNMRFVDKRPFLQCRFDDLLVVGPLASALSAGSKRSGFIVCPGSPEHRSSIVVRSSKNDLEYLRIGYDE